MLKLKVKVKLKMKILRALKLRLLKMEWVWPIVRNFELKTPIVSRSMEMKQLDRRDSVLKQVILRLMPK